MGGRFKRREHSSGNFYDGVGLKDARGDSPAARVEGSVSADPPFPNSPHAGGSIGENGNNPHNPPLNLAPYLPTLHSTLHRPSMTLHRHQRESARSATAISWLWRSREGGRPSRWVDETLMDAGLT